MECDCVDTAAEWRAVPLSACGAASISAAEDHATSIRCDHFVRATMKWLPNVNADDRFYGSDGDDVGGGSCEDVDGSCEDENSQKGDDDDEKIE